jgi:hypothetical protein
MNTLDWKNATPEQINFWNQCQGLIAWTTITPLFYQGTIAGSEFLVYSAAKMYIALEFEASGDTSADVGVSYITFYGLGDAVIRVAGNVVPVWHATEAAVKYSNNVMQLKNLYFFKITNSTYPFLKFNGYRLNI